MAITPKRCVFIWVCLFYCIFVVAFSDGGVDRTKFLIPSLDGPLQKLKMVPPKNVKSPLKQPNAPRPDKNPYSSSIEPVKPTAPCELLGSKRPSDLNIQRQKYLNQLVERVQESAVSKRIEHYGTPYELQPRPGGIKINAGLKAVPDSLADFPLKYDFGTNSFIWGDNRYIWPSPVSKDELAIINQATIHSDYGGLYLDLQSLDEQGTIQADYDQWVADTKVGEKMFEADMLLGDFIYGINSNDGTYFSSSVKSYINPKLMVLETISKLDAIEGTVFEEMYKQFQYVGCQPTWVSGDMRLTIGEDGKVHVEGPNLGIILRGHYYDYLGEYYSDDQYRLCPFEKHLVQDFVQHQEEYKNAYQPIKNLANYATMVAVLNYFRGLKNVDFSEIPQPSHIVRSGFIKTHNLTPNVWALNGRDKKRAAPIWVNFLRKLLPKVTTGNEKAKCLLIIASYQTYQGDYEGAEETLSSAEKEIPANDAYYSSGLIIQNRANIALSRLIDIEKLKSKCTGKTYLYAGYGLFILGLLLMVILKNISSPKISWVAGKKGYMSVVLCLLLGLAMVGINFCSPWLLSLMFNENELFSKTKGYLLETISYDREKGMADRLSGDYYLVSNLFDTFAKEENSSEKIIAPPAALESEYNDLLKKIENLQVAKAKNKFRNFIENWEKKFRSGAEYTSSQRIGGLIWLANLNCQYIRFDEGLKDILWAEKFCEKEDSNMGWSAFYGCLSDYYDSYDKQYVSIERYKYYDQLAIQHVKNGLWLKALRLLGMAYSELGLTSFTDFMISAKGSLMTDYGYLLLKEGRFVDAESWLILGKRYLESMSSPDPSDQKDISRSLFWLGISQLVNGNRLAARSTVNSYNLKSGLNSEPLLSGIDFNDPEQFKKAQKRALEVIKEN